MTVIDLKEQNDLLHCVLSVSCRMLVSFDAESNKTLPCKTLFVSAYPSGFIP